MSRSTIKSQKTNEKSVVQSNGLGFLHWTERHFRMLSIIILILAGMLRLSLLIELPQMPFNQLHTAPDLDMNFFDQWGDRIAQGDILTDTIWHPYHFWHDAIAKSYGLQTDVEGREKWNEWYGGKKYHQEPLYALCVGLAKIITGDGRLLVYVLQMLLSLVSIWMVIWLGKHYFNALSGLIAGVLFTFYGPALLFDVTLLRTSFSTTILLGAVVVSEQLMAGKPRAWLMGIIGGLGYLLMTTTLLLWLPLVFRWLYHRRMDVGQAWKTALPFIVCISFLVVRNSITDSPILSSSSVGPITYVLANFPEYKPEMGFIFFATAGEIMETSKGEMIPAALSVIAKHESIMGWIILQFKKLGSVFHWYEIPNNVNTYLATAFSQTLKISLIPYSLIAALGLMGIGLNISNKKIINLHIAILSQIAVMVAFYVLSRFRVPMVAMLCVFAGYTIQQLTLLKNVKRTSLIIAGTTLFYLLLCRPVPVIPPTFTRGDLNTNFNAYYRPKLDLLSQQGDLAGCAALIEDFLKTVPSYLEYPDQLKTLKTPIEKDVAYYYGLVYTDLGNVYTEIGKTDKASACLARGKNLLAAGQQ